MAFWRPEVSPSTLILEPAPAGFEPTALDSSRLELVATHIFDGSERELVVIEGADEIHLRLHGNGIERPAVVVPIDGAFDLRLDVALRFGRRLQGRRGRLLPDVLRLTSAQKARLVRLLHAFDIHSAGGGPREIAAEVLSSPQAALPSIEWKDSHSRRAANRLIHDSMALVQQGYLKLLRGR